MPDMDRPEPGLEDATRRTHLALERTLLAWWRSGMAAVAVALAVGRLVPALLGTARLPFAILGAGFGILAVALFVLGGWRDRVVRGALAERRYEPLPDAAVWVITGTFALLAAATIVLIVTEG
jgi:uncharacterized membrane protein YidH (DUF202 family)